MKKIIKVLIVLSILVGGCSSNKRPNPNDYATPCPGIGCEGN